MICQAAGTWNPAMRLLQRLALRHREAMRLCPLFFEGTLARRGEGSDYVMHRLDAMLDRG